MHETYLQKKVEIINLVGVVLLVTDRPCANSTPLKTSAIFQAPTLDRQKFKQIMKFHTFAFVTNSMSGPGSVLKILEEDHHLFWEGFQKKGKLSTLGG